MRFLLIGVLVEAATVQAQAPASEPVLVTSGSFFALSVPDLAASRAWYEEKLGLKVTLTPPPYQGVEAVILEGGGLIVELIHNPAAKRSEQDPVLTHGFFKAGVIIEDYIQFFRH